MRRWRRDRPRICTNLSMRANRIRGRLQSLVGCSVSQPTTRIPSKCSTCQASNSGGRRCSQFTERGRVPVCADSLPPNQSIILQQLTLRYRRWRCSIHSRHSLRRWHHFRLILLFLRRLLSVALNPLGGVRPWALHALSSHSRDRHHRCTSRLRRGRRIFTGLAILARLLPRWCGWGCSERIELPTHAG